MKNLPIIFYAISKLLGIQWLIDKRKTSNVKYSYEYEQNRTKYTVYENKLLKV